MRLIDADALYRKVKTECNPYGMMSLTGYCYQNHRRKFATMKIEIDTGKIVDNVVSEALEREIDGKTIEQWITEIAKYKWISVKDKLPEPLSQCLVYSPRRNNARKIETATYTKLGWITATYFPEVTHWMPLPELPEEDEEDG